MIGTKYIGLDVHQATMSVAVMDSAGHLVMECALETKASTILEFIEGMRGRLYVTFEEGTWAAWLYDLLKPHVTKLLVCDPRKNALLKSGNKSDRIDARKLAALLRAGLLSPVYHGEAGVRTLKELARSYLTLTRDVTRVMSRIKAVYRSWAIPCAGQRVYSPSYRSQWLEKLPDAGVRRRAEWLYTQLDQLLPLRRQARQALLAESRKHPANRCLQSIPSLGSIRAAILMAVIQTPHRFRTKRQLWAYSGLALETHSSGDYRLVAGQLQRSKKLSNTGGLNANHNHDLKYVFMSAAISSSVCPGPLREFYAGLLAKGARPSMARVTLARKIAAVSLILWKKGEQFDADKLKLQAA
jgi:transposase